MLLQITDGTSTITLSGTSPVLGCTYFPAPPQGGGAMGDGGAAQGVTETVEVNLRGTAEQVRATINAVETLLQMATVAAPVPVYAFYKPVDADAALYRSRIRTGRVVWSDNPGLRRLGDTNPTVRVAVIWTRLPFWETINEQDGGVVHILNGDAVLPSAGYWMGMGGPTTYSGSVALGEGNNARNAGEWTNLAGVLPTPPHITITNEDAGSIAVKRVYIANDVYARFTGSQHQLAYGYEASWGGPSAHDTVRWTAQLSNAQIAAALNGGSLRLLAVFSALTAGVYLRAKLQQKVDGGVLLDTWIGPEMLSKSGRYVYDLGCVGLPPSVAAYSDLWLTMTVWATASGSGALDYIQLCPGDNLVVLEGTGSLLWSPFGAVDWYGDERYATLKWFHGSLVASGALLLQPARANRLMVLAEGATGVGSEPLAVRVRYRPRRVTV